MASAHINEGSSVFCVIRLCAYIVQHLGASIRVVACICWSVRQCRQLLEM